jgi:hypothetical protein
MELRPAEPAAVAELRDEKLRTYHVPLLPNFHIHLAHHADTYEIRDEASSVGYALLLIDRHEGHDHVSLVEAYLTPPYRDRYEDALTAIKEEFRPQAYLARSDDCVFQTALIAMGHQMEISMAVMVARATYPPPDRKDLGLAPLDYAYLRPAHDIYVHSRGVQQAPTYSELEAEMQYDRYWVLTEGGQAVGLLVREESQGTRYCLLDIMAPHQPDEPQVWALRTVARDVEGEGLTCAAVVDARDPHKIELFRQAGYYTSWARTIGKRAISLGRTGSISALSRGRRASVSRRTNASSSTATTTPERPARSQLISCDSWVSPTWPTTPAVSRTGRRRGCRWRKARAIPTSRKWRRRVTWAVGLFERIMGPRTGDPVVIYHSPT